jgi:hypothetical protein
MALLPYDRFPSAFPYPTLRREKSFVHSPQQITRSNNCKFLPSKRFNYRSFSITGDVERSVYAPNNFSESYFTRHNELNLSKRTNSVPNVSLDIPFFIQNPPESVSLNEDEKKPDGQSNAKSVASRRTSRRKRIAPKPPSESEASLPTILIHASGKSEMEKEEDRNDLNEKTNRLCPTNRPKTSKGRNSSRTRIGRLFSKSREPATSRKNEDTDEDDRLSVGSVPSPISSDDSVSTSSSCPLAN